MTNYLISFPAAAMTLTGEALQRSDTESRKVVAQAKAAGVWVFGAGIDEGVAPELVDADGTVTPGGYPGAPPITGGFAVFNLPTRAEAIVWATRFAVACGCPQELREFHYDPESLP